ncbi:MAG: tRNA (guanosine(46)-N7)-methyltransferase TrmB [Lachnospiraceae bacterium]|nr:tRNA (guanosine(46)-N7)-methyltransferase TrmB [Lachnospiraceae bacterium]
MRLKNVKGSQEKIEAHVNTIQADDVSGKNYKGRWKELFNNDNPIHIEIGMGKGKFLMDMAEKYPDINFVGIEKFSSVLVRAIEKLEERKSPSENSDKNCETKSDNTEACDQVKPFKNIIFLRMDAENILDFFEENEIDKIYLNFSDPWPKVRHAKRRLTSTTFLPKYKIILKPNGLLQFKTDNKDLFDFSVKEVKKFGLKMEELDYDIHKDGPMQDNVMTEYEEKFYNLGNPIMRMVVKFEK